MKNFILPLLIVSILSSCGTGTPSCTDSDVTDIAFEVFEEEYSSTYKKILFGIIKDTSWESAKEDAEGMEELKVEFLKTKYTGNYKYKEGETHFINIIGERLAYKASDYELKDFFYSNNEEIISQIEALAKLVWEEDVKREFVNIRLEKVNDKIKKCSCAAEMEFNISSEGLTDLGLEEDNVYKLRSVLFNAQNTDDGLLVWFGFTE